jgi:hypothetical protein
MLPKEEAGNAALDYQRSDLSSTSTVTLDRRRRPARRGDAGRSDALSEVGMLEYLPSYADVIRPAEAIAALAGARSGIIWPLARICGLTDPRLFEKIVVPGWRQLYRHVYMSARDWKTEMTGFGGGGPPIGSRRAKPPPRCFTKTATRCSAVCGLWACR